MEKKLMCPRTEICFFYRVYVDSTNDDRLGIIEVSTIENRDFYGCSAFEAVQKLARAGKLAEDIKKRIAGTQECYLMDQANKRVEKHRADT
ncbi:MAG: hypothetical protein NTX52_04890 [Planctomycetota bacterium]|nr:hypothetical protein [Planctomycetota bacterium]